MTLIEWRTSVDAVSVEVVSRAGRRKRTGEGCTDTTLAVALVDAEHSNVSPEVTLTMGRLLAHYNPDGMRNILRICL
jgi:hypothetical protein